MADPLSMVTGILGVVTATAQSAAALYRLVQSFRDQPQALRRLREELGSLCGVLHSLETLVKEDESRFVPLKLPLERCCRACADVDALIRKCAAHSDGGKPSLRDWARLRYMDSDINGLTEMLERYKATIGVALADANLRSSTVTLRVLDEYKAMIRTTAGDLEDHLAAITAKLQTVVTFGPAPPVLTQTDVRRLQKERDSTKKCLEICAEGLARINELKLRPVCENGLPPGADGAGISSSDLTLADTMTLLALKECSHKLSEVLCHLRANDEYAKGRLQATGAQGRPTLDAEDDLQELVKELDSTKHCLEVVSDASDRVSSGKIHVVEDIVVGEGGQQLLITTRDQLFQARRVTLESKATQVIMSASDAAVQEYLHGHARK